MREIEGDLWDHLGKRWLCVPVNIGFTKPQDPTEKAGPAVMGAGLAKQAAERIPYLPYFWGMYCEHYKALTPVTWTPRGLILFPTKPLDQDRPWMSWKHDASPTLIERSAKELSELVLPPGEELAHYAFGAKEISDEVVIPLVGCGCGRLPEETVLPILHTWLKGDRFLLLRQPKIEDSSEHPF